MSHLNCVCDGKLHSCLELYEFDINSWVNVMFSAHEFI